MKETEAVGDKKGVLRYVWQQCTERPQTLKKGTEASCKYLIDPCS